ncbi:hypothetical protein [Chondromyces crocatus]|uniref:Secreted protein n=1 Tax=Chondromyces crocatus TaxID=52 RepID=A0A0K1EG81_CHOCO|nr:hypothetical protein [Chondromyces crocatus]AKT39885.1 uncharacterized protein CMC5_040360 [Chondromyces crocatus]
MRRAATFLCGLSLLCTTAPAVAQNAAARTERVEPSAALVPVRLELRTSPDVLQCPGEKRLREEISVRLGHSPFDDAARTAVIVTIARRDHDLTGRVVYLDADRPLEAREFVVPDDPRGCFTLLEYLAVAIAFTLTPFGDDDLSRTPPGTTEAAPPGPARRTELRLGVGGQLSLGYATDPTLAALFHVQLRWPAHSLSLEGRFRPPAATYGDRGTPLELRSEGLAVSACVHESLFFACTAGEFGLLHLHNPERLEQGGRYAAVSVGLRAGVELFLSERFLLQLRADVATSVAPGPLRLDRDEWRNTPLSGGLGGALMTRF